MWLMAGWPCWPTGPASRPRAVVGVGGRADDVCVLAEGPVAAGAGPVFEVRLLGPVRAVRAGGEVALGGPRQRAVLALLMLEAGRVVPFDRLVEAVWRGRPPPGVAKTLRSYVSRLRSLLGP